MDEQSIHKPQSPTPKVGWNNDWHVFVRSPGVPRAFSPAIRPCCPQRDSEACMSEPGAGEEKLLQPPLQKICPESTPPTQFNQLLLFISAENKGAYATPNQRPFYETRDASSASNRFPSPPPLKRHPTSNTKKIRFKSTLIVDCVEALAVPLDQPIRRG